MNYQETLNFLYQQLPMFHRIGAAAYKADLKNITALCEKLNHPQKQLKFIHIAGTNGKGSVSHMLAAIFQKNGYTTGLFTSPHLIDYRERIKLNGIPISKQYVIKFVEKNINLVKDIQPSFFEWTTALAFQYFYDKKADIVILETGMGGRLDSTNIITPELSIITNIGEDHKQFLGDTLEKIAYEKAGIIKPNIPVLISEYQKETAKVFRNKAKETNSNLFYAKDIVKIEKHKQSNKYLELYYKIIYNKLNLFLDKSKKLNNNNKNNIFDYSNKKIINKIKNNLDISKNNSVQKVLSSLNAQYQIKNIRCVLAAVEILKLQNLHLKDRLIKTAIQNTPQITGFRGRWETLNLRPLIIADIAHNKQGIIETLKNIKRYNYNHLKIIFGIVQDKEIESILPLLPKNAEYYFTQPSVPRALPVEDLMKYTQQYQLKGNAFKNIKSAFNAAIQHANHNDFILIFGSAFLVADFLEFWDKRS